MNSGDVIRRTTIKYNFILFFTLSSHFKITTQGDRPSLPPVNHMHPTITSSRQGERALFV